MDFNSNKLIKEIYKHGYSMKEFTDKCKLNYGTIWRTIRANGKFRKTTIYLMAEELGFTYEDMEKIANG